MFWKNFAQTIFLITAAASSSSNTSATGQMTREELERHLELKQSAKPQYMSVEKTPYSLPDDIFSNDNSNQDGELLDVKTEDDLSHCQFAESLP
ncbi:hypothetical protein LSH36_15g12034 [Paralvinella palmiformis]|uniref:Uncharacterized protein n=1 Tax=Paralvinella palmiformis TaxID=53620 RepID=A0AAD9KDV2_9ANNE|nr:hypothetical protein LSH36_15g12034 [Paralvinella palmiformis]